MADNAKPNMSEADVERINMKLNELKVHSSIARYNTDTLFGRQFEGDRNLYSSLGWEEYPTYATYDGQYRRGGIAKTVVDIDPIDTWRGDIRVVAPPDQDGNAQPNAEAFEKGFIELAERVNLKEYFLRGDKLAGIGQYSVLRLGLQQSGDQGDKMEAQPVSPNTVQDLLYVSAYSQPNADIVKTFNDPQEPRFGQVQVYSITETNNQSKAITGGTTVRGRRIDQNADQGEGLSSNVHADRIIHIAENLLEDEIYGTPRLENILNHLYDLQKVSGGSAEMYWQGAFPGYIFELDPEAELSPDDLQKMEQEIDKRLLGLKRYLKVQGVNVNAMSPQVSDPTSQVNVQIDQIAGARRIPKRTLLGSERGELSSGADESNRQKQIQSRRENDCNRWVRDFVDKMMKYGVLPKVDHYIIDWPSLADEKAKEKAEIALNRSRAIKEFMQAGGENVLPFQWFFTEVMDWPEEMARAAVNALEGVFEDDDDEDDDLIGDPDPDRREQMHAELRESMQAALLEIAASADSDDDDEE